MENKRVKRTCKGKEQECDSNDAVDRISELPTPIIHRILSFIPTVYAVRMSVLSKRWKQMWYSVPTLTFSHTLGFRKLESFHMFVEKCLLHRSRAMPDFSDSAVTSFKLDFLLSSSMPRPAANKWFESPIIQNNVQELVIHATRSGNADHCEFMPYGLLNGKSLRVLKLGGMRFDGSRSINLPSLKSLYLEDVRYGNSDVLRKLILQCPSLEIFVLKGLSEVYNDIKISSSSLSFLEIRVKCKLIEVDALKLQSLVVDFCGHHHSRIDFSLCRAIKNLSLSNLNLDDQISLLPNLENLHVGLRVTYYKHIKISSPTLKRLSLEKSNEQKLEVTIETPNLASFKYQGDVELCITMKMETTRLNGILILVKEKCKTNWYVNEKYKLDWYVKLINFLSTVNCSWKSLNLCTYKEEALIIPEYLRRICHQPFPNQNYLKVTIFGKLSREVELRKSMEWIFPSLKRLSIAKGHMRAEPLRICRLR